MTSWKRRLLRISITLGIIYILLCGLMYFFQEKFIFHPKKLSADFKFEYPYPFEEKLIKTTDGKNLNGLLFKADSAKGLVFYLHGNAGALDSWGNIAENYLSHHCDLFIMDYRGFGKSEGQVESEEQLFSDVQTAYDTVKRKYPEEKIVIVGYSIGTCPAAMLASKNYPSKLILQAPYYSLVDMMHRNYPMVPGFLLNYKMETFKYVKELKVPLTIFHGDADEGIPYECSVQLKEFFKPGDELVKLPGQGHNGINEHPIFQANLKKLLGTSL